ncbi:hypothetical protein AS9A_0840 [Hoyosella subflava DQS3-9A1]|uniref:Uncharacterized protein n=1 Tax=Hoyosella subflava (strain DSM 45089 / JCM 17490 / NBRC 109087 / DQS3-9A1) TaxID=443218 RepID=F6EM86_HOYSD|nr:hypothetical protein AS9A_0840 [Hoyosella subflava DQS3-9A1]
MRVGRDMPTGPREVVVAARYGTELTSDRFAAAAGPALRWAARV